MHLILARHVLPILSPPVEDGAVLVDGDRIVSVGRRREVEAETPAETPRVDLGDSVLLPALVNAHVHLDLSWMAGDRPPGGDYLAWVRALVDARVREDPDTARQAAGGAVAQLEGFGVGGVGDIGNTRAAADALASSSLEGFVAHEVLGFRPDRAEAALWKGIEALEDLEGRLASAGDRFLVTLAAHAPHTVSAKLLKALAGHAGASGAPLPVHVAESPQEVAFLAGSEAGRPWREFLEERGQWDPDWTPPGLSPVAYLDRLHVLGPRTVAVHCVHVDHADLGLLQQRGVRVVVCPRSNAYLGVGEAPVQRMLGAGIPVALGTDSLASAPDLNVLHEVAALVHGPFGIAPAAALRMATLNGALAVGRAERLGALAPGRTARMIAVEWEPAAGDPQEWITMAPEQVRWVAPPEFGAPAAS